MAREDAMRRHSTSDDSWCSPQGSAFGSYPQLVALTSDVSQRCNYRRLHASDQVRHSSPNVRRTIHLPHLRHAAVQRGQLQKQTKQGCSCKRARHDAKRRTILSFHSFVSHHQQRMWTEWRRGKKVPTSGTCDRLNFLMTRGQLQTFITAHRKKTPKHTQIFHVLYGKILAN